nr:uncharacterized protein LOC116768778 isoform X2 [Danaus plexippus plexippus]
MTEYIRIKFTPFVKHVSSSNCCWLEIIPKVSCIEHLDKIEWKQQTLSMEYIVPMTYKIILRKREPEKKLKMYYSCIDLLSSISSHNLCSGDVRKQISDNIILSKVLSESRNNESLKRTCVKRDPLLVTNDIIETGHALVPKEKTVGNINTKTDNTFVLKQNEYKSKGDGIDQEVPTVTNSEIEKSTGNVKIKADTGSLYYSKHSSILNRDEKLNKRLCITPKCKLNTADKIFCCNNKVNTDISVPYFVKPKEDRILVNNVRNIVGTQCFSANNFSFNNASRVEPTIRIAHFVQKMEEEVFPLKLLLDELIRKCSSLGLNTNKEPKHFSQHKYNPIKIFTNKTRGDQRKIQSNRVVYSFVSDN